MFKINILFGYLVLVFHLNHLILYIILNINKSYYNKAPDSQVFPRSNNALKYIKKENLKKANIHQL